MLVERYAAGTPVYPGASNVYVPSHESTQGLIVDFSRNPDSFKMNRYIKLIPVQKLKGLFARFGRDGGLPEEAARITDSNLANYVWNDGNDSPSGNDLKELFQFCDYSCTRYAPTTRMGDLMVDQASWNIKDQYSRILAQLAMTIRTQRVITAATTSGNYVSGHTSAVASITGNTGTWDNSTAQRLDIQRSIDYAVDLILRDTLGVVKREDLLLVMNPTCAAKISRSQEIRDYLKQQSGSIQIIEGEWDNKQFQIPKQIAGVELVVEDAVKVTNHKAATRAASYILGETTPFITSRPGALVGTDSQAPNFSGLTCMVYDQNEMLSEFFHNEEHKYSKARVVDTIDVQVTASAAMFLFTSATS